MYRRMGDIRNKVQWKRKQLFVGNEGGGVSMAVLASFEATCKDNGIDFEKWLADVLVRLDCCPTADIRTLLSHNWKPKS